MNLRHLMDDIERHLPEGGQWCSLEKGHTLAALIVGLRPAVVVEIGVWLGGSLVPMLMALKMFKCGRAVAIDPWSADASKDGEVIANAEWWSQIDHEKAYQTFLRRLDKHELVDYCTIARQCSDDVSPPENIGLLHVDGNHTVQAIRDVERFAPHVDVGGIMVLDDVSWEGGHVSRAREIAMTMGFVEMYPLGTGIAMQRRRT